MVWKRAKAGVTRSLKSRALIQSEKSNRRSFDSLRSLRMTSKNKYAAFGTTEVVP